MEKSVSLKPVMASTARPNGKTPPRDKTLGIEPEICFYGIEDGDKTKEGEESETLVIYNSRLKAYKQKIVKIKFLFIDMFNN